MPRRHRQCRGICAGQALETLAPDFLVVPLRAPGDAAGVARLEGGGARRIVAAEADCHDADALGVDLWACSEIFPCRGGVAFGLVVQVEIAKADALAIAR